MKQEKKNKRLWTILKSMYHAAWENETYFQPEKIIEKAYKKIMNWRKGARRA